ncbi:MAG: hypothetical protein ACKOC5_08680 [Chloroflexota bacterium]
MTRGKRAARGDPWAGIAAAVVLQALDDLTGSDPLRAVDALAWMSDDENSSAPLLCAVIGLRPDAITRLKFRSVRARLKARKGSDNG